MGCSRARQQRADVVGALDTFIHGTRSYLLVSTLFGLIVAAVDTGFLWLVGVPLPLLWGLLAFITNYIPNVGFIIGLITALLALLEGELRLMAIVIVAYSVINFVIQWIIQPKFVADAVNLSLTLTFLSLVFWAFVVGPLGAVLAIPLTLLAKALFLASTRTPGGSPACSSAEPSTPRNRTPTRRRKSNPMPPRIAPQ